MKAKSGYFPSVKHNILLHSRRPFCKKDLSQNPLSEVFLSINIDLFFFAARSDKHNRRMKIFDSVVGRSTGESALITITRN